jgi:hypothetical protein
MTIGFNAQNFYGAKRTGLPSVIVQLKPSDNVKKIPG